MTWERLRGSYDAVASRYEATFVDELAGKPADRDRLEAFATAVGGVGGGPVVELGCGPGQIGRAVADHGCRVVGVDLSPEMARLASPRLGAATTGDLRAVPLRSGVAAGVISYYALIHLRRAEQGAAWAEIARILRPGGRALVTAHEGEGTIEGDDFLGAGVPFVATLLSLDELIAGASGAGLDVVASDRREPYPTEHPTVRLTVEAVRP